MAKKSNKKRSNTDIVESLTADLIEQIEAGQAPWVQPWTSNPLKAPQNGHSGRGYNGINVLILWMRAASKGYADSRWVTFRQAKKLGGSVRKGEKGTQILFWRFIEKTDEDEETGETTKKKIPLARVYTVFNVEQCDGLDLEAPKEPEAFAHDDVTPAALITALGKLAGTTFFAVGDRAYYDLAVDHVRVPSLERFNSAEHYAATLAHELVHWTGTEERCDRKFGKRFGDDAYAFEELVAEMGAAFTCATFGIRGELQHAEYLAHWAKIAKADTYALVTAAKQAELALAFLLEEAGGEEAVRAEADKLLPAMEREHRNVAEWNGAKPAAEPAAGEQLALL